MRDYLVYVRDEARTRFDAGLAARDAAFDIALGDYAGWGDAERIAVNVATLYREFAGDPEAGQRRRALRADGRALARAEAVTT